MKIFKKVEKFSYIIFILVFLVATSAQLLAQTDTLFWFVAPDVNEHHSDRPVGFHFTNPSTTRPAVVNVSLPAEPAFTPFNFTIPPSSSYYLDVTDRGGFGLNPTNKTWKNYDRGLFSPLVTLGPITTIDSIENKPENTVNKKGIRIISSAPVTCYYEVKGFNYQGQQKNSDIFALKGNAALGLEFYTPFQNIAKNHADASITDYVWRSAFDIVATEDGTVVEITPTKNLIGHPANVTYTITLNKGETYSGVAASEAAAEHPAGTYIKSNKPIAVTIKDDSVSDTSFGIGLIGDQLVPIDIVGTSYIVNKGSMHNDRLVTDPLYRVEYAFILATQDNTTINADGVNVATINKGVQYLHSFNTDVTTINTNKPVYLLHVSGVNDEPGGAIVPTITCTGSDTVGFVRSSPDPFFLSVIVPTGGEGNFRLNGSSTLIQASDFATIPNTGGAWQYARKQFNNTDIPSGLDNVVINTTNFFHLSTFNGNSGGDANYGYFSNFDFAAPTITVQPISPAVFCDGNTTKTITVSAIGKGTITYQWRLDGVNIVNDAVFSGATTNTLTITNPTASLNGKVIDVLVGRPCSPQTIKSSNVSLQVNPIPVIDNGNKAICSGESTNINLTASNSINPTFTWTSPAVANITGNTNGSGNTINQTITTSALVDTDFQYTVTPTANGCVGTPRNIIVTVKPLPSITNSLTKTICSGDNTNISLTSSPSGASFSWTSAAVPNLIGNSDGSGNAISHVLSQNTANPISVSYDITPTLNGCIGSNVLVNVSVNPIPAISNGLNFSICSNNATNISLASSVSGTTFAWTTAAVAGITGNTGGTGNQIIQTLNNTNTASTDVIYRVTPTANTCIGIQRDITVNVHPRPNVNSVPLSKLCSGTSTNIVLGSDVTGATFTWTSLSVTGISGNANGSGASINQGLINSSNDSLDLVYSVTATANTCAGTPTNINVRVYPRPFLTNTNLFSICSGETTKIGLSSNVSATSYNWTTASVSDVIGNTAGSGDSIKNILTNSSNAFRNVIYTVTPNANGCSGSSTDITVELKPLPLINPQSEDICSGNTSNLVINSNIPSSLFSWTSPIVAGISGNTSGSGAAISQGLTNNTNNIIPVVYIVIPSSNGCIGEAKNMTINVIPRPIVNNISTVEICSGSTTNIGLSSNIAGSTYSWTTLPVAGITGNNNSSGVVIAQTLTNNTNNVLEIDYFVTATSSGCPSSPPLNVKVQVAPIPLISGSTSFDICSGITTNIPLSSNVAGAIFSWTTVSVAGVTGNISGSGNIISQRLDNTTNANQNIIYAISPTANNCSGGPYNIDVLIRPIPEYTGTNQDSICSGNTTSVSLSSNVVGNTFSWVSNAVIGVTGNANGSGNNISQTLNNSTSAALDVLYQITPFAGTCAGNTANLSIKVYPNTIAGTTSGGNSICEGGTSNALSVTGNTGSIVRWEFSVSPFPTWQTINHQGSTYTSAALTETTRFRAVVASGVCPQVNSNFTTVTVIPGVIITGQMSPDDTICEGQAGNALSLSGYVGSLVRWERSESPFNIWSPIINNVDTYNPGTLTQTTKYRVVISNGVCPEANSEIATITVNQNPRITQQPTVPTALCEGVGVDEFEIVASGTNLTYQWKENGQSIVNAGIYSGATSTKLTITNPPFTLNGRSYQVDVSGTCGNISSSPVTITINEKTVINSPPLDPTVVCDGVAANFSVSASGTNLVYQWRENGVNLINSSIHLGVNTTNLQIPASTISMDGRLYDVIVSGECGVLTSTQAKLRVNPQTDIINVLQDISICEGLSVNFQIQALGSNLRYQWREDGVNITNSGSYEGTDEQILSINPAIASLSNKRYDVVVQGDCGSETSNSAILTVNTPVSLLSSPLSDTLCEGNIASFSVSATGTNLTYQWKQNGINLANGGNFSDVNTATLKINNVNISQDSSNYEVEVSGLCSSGSSAKAFLRVNSNTSILTSPKDSSICAGGTVQFSVSASGVSTSYQWKENGVNISDNSIYNGTNSSVLTINSPNIDFNQRRYQVEVNGLCGSINSNQATLNIFELSGITNQPADVVICEGQDATFKVDVLGSNQTYQWKENNVNLIDNGTYSGTNTSTLTIRNANSLLDNKSYQLVLTASCGNINSTRSFLTVNRKTSLSLQPRDTTLCSGGTAKFSTNAVGANLRYTWNKNGVALLSETSPSISIFNTNTLMSGDTYSVTINGLCGDTSTRDGLLTVNPLTSIINAPIDQSLCERANANFSVQASGSNLSYQWREDGRLLLNEQNASLIINNVDVSQSGRSYEATVNGLCGSVISDKAILVVNPATVILSQPRDTVVCEGSDARVLFTVAGTGLKYQWKENDIYLLGETKPFFEILKVDKSKNQFKYAVEVTGSCGAVNSTAATLTVNDATQGGIVDGDNKVCEGSVGTILSLNGYIGNIVRWEKAEVLNQNWQPITNNSNLLNTDPINQEVRYRAVVKNGVCPERFSAEKVITIDQRPSMAFGGENLSVCDSITVLNATPPSIGLGQWLIINPNNDALITEISNPNSQFTGRSNSSYQLVWTVANGVCEPSRDTVQIQFRNAIKLVTSSDTTIKKGTSAQLWVSGASNYQWTPVSTLNNPSIYNPIASPKVNQWYIVVGNDGFGCSATDSILVSIDDNTKIKIPNTFSPNDDGTHEFWVIENVELYPEASLDIFNRWGQLIRSLKGGSNIKWDGKNNNGVDMEVGTYFYVFKEDKNDEGKAGSISIIK